MDPTPLTLHKDGTATYWSVYDQAWHKRVPVESIPDRELAAMPEHERRRVIRARASIHES